MIAPNSIEEVEEAIRSLIKRVIPGLYGLTRDPYQLFPVVNARIS